MPDLPQGWELDYDGSRWIYRFTASGLTQYQFPKPGDEFPEFVDVGASFDMAPEDCLASDRQVKRQSMNEGGIEPTKPPTTQRKPKPLEDIKEADSVECFDIEKFMYLGPGSFFGSGPRGDQQTRMELEAKQSSMDRQQTPPSIKQRGAEAGATNTGQVTAGNLVNEDSGTAQEPPPQVMGGASKRVKPGEGNAITAQPTQPRLRMQSPVGFVAELASRETGKQENHMSNIEPNAPDRSTAGGPDAQPSRLVELLAHEKPMDTKQPQPQEARVTSAQTVDSYPLVWASFSFPPLPPKHPIGPPNTSSFPQTAVLPQKSSSQEMARPLSCHEVRMSKGYDFGNSPKKSETRFASMPELPTLPTVAGVKPPEPKRYSVQGPGPLVVWPSRRPMLPMPSTQLDSPVSYGAIDFQSHQRTKTAPPAPPPKIPISSNEIKADSSMNTAWMPGSEARHERASSDTSHAFISSFRSSGLAQCPSVLRPGYRRSSATSPPQPSQRSPVLAAPDRQPPYQQHVSSILPIQLSHHAHESVTLQTQKGPQWRGGHVFEELAVRMPDERDFTVRQTAPTRAAPEAVVVLSPTSASSLKPPSHGPGMMIFHEVGPVDSKREPEPGPMASRPGKPWMEDIHELGCGSPLPIELPSDGGTHTKPSQPPPFVAPLRLAPSASRVQGQLPPPTASAAQELAAMSSVYRGPSCSTPNVGNSAWTHSST